jgi:hypothetical protein
VKVQAAHVDQVRLAGDEVYILSKDAGTVAGDLAAMDSGLEVRFAKHTSCWLIVHVSHPGCLHNGNVGDYGEYLVSSVQAHRGNSGVWTGLDDRLVTRFREIRPGGSYDYAQALEDSTRRKHSSERAEFHERTGEAAELAAHEIRKAEGTKYRGRVFVPRSL